MATSIEAHEKNIRDVFSDAYEFEIPPYQRPYTWERDHARELIVDLLDAMDNQEINGGLYFLGSVVLVKEPGKPVSKVIDGQQRLTTLTILLSVLRDLTTDEEIRIDRRAYIYQKASADRGLKSRHRLSLRDADQPFFFKYVQDIGATNQAADLSKLDGSQRRLAENTELLRSYLKDLPEPRRDDLVGFILQKCYLVVVSVPAADAARRIFTVLNARGMDLTPTDILKAEMIEIGGSDQEQSLSSRWEIVEQRVGRDSMVVLFGHIRMMYERDKPRSSLESGFKNCVPLFSTQPEKFLTDILEPISEVYLRISRDAQVRSLYGSEAARAVRSLHRIDNKDWIPPVLLCLLMPRSADASEVARLLIDLERVAYFMFVTRAGVNERIKRFSEVMDQIDGDPCPAEPRLGLALTDPEQKAFLRSLSGSLYLETKVCRPVLHRLDEALSTRGATYDDSVSIEHVLPQTVDKGSEWANLFPQEQQRTEWTHRLANLVLLTQRVNARASNWSFDRKKKEYFSSSDGSSPFPLTQGVLRTSEWTPQHLEKRQEELLLKLCDVWNLDPIYIEQHTSEVVKEKGRWKFTGADILNAKRIQIRDSISNREGAELEQKGAQLWSADMGIRAICSISKRYEGRSTPYWYGYTPEWHAYLAQSSRSFCVFGCVDRERAYAVPAKEMERVLPDLNRSGDRHWHIFLDDNEQEGLDLVLKTGVRVSLNKYELSLVPKTLEA